ncbi:TonB-linked outer membrane protein, SusC/RagA family [Parapedobacter luteus]|uniref:TonB-linked outer membrane protein, SusC/RagA family n=1 Tax=Parapedobacter luteus TaxID=623280 RepID=A0A1T5CJF8_9SPHI|nr:SusC/RagA family TonB-linked outer membrane protein [Parapedobacter luteus]SKB59625.1 TonB-linked outer membrane protein, SusC/RagA family [Parapedobacter luteus]
MKRNLRLWGCYAFIQKATKDFLCVQTLAQAPAHPGPGLAIGVIMFLMPLAMSHTAHARQQHQAADRVAGSGDTSRTMKDTLLLEEVQINAGYYTVKDRERTGSIGRVDGKTIARQPVGNPLAALHGQVPGVEVTQQSGVPGGNVVLRIRGQNSMLNGNDPLYIIDGVPLSAAQNPLNQLNNAAGEGAISNIGAGISPLSLLNPADIQSIEVLKDADATAIYGSRGANGVILITTKKGVEERLAVNAGFRTGLSTPARSMDMLSGPQYLTMRKEAFANDGIEPSSTNAPDLMLWDTTRYTDFKDLLIGQGARYNDAQLSISGGSARSSYLISGSYHDESTVFDAEVAHRRYGLHSQATLRNGANNLRVNSSFTVSSASNALPVRDLTRYIKTSPFLRLYNDDGSLAWENGGIPYRNLGLQNANPLAFRNQEYDATQLNIIGQNTVSYLLTQELSVLVNTGFNVVRNDEHSRNPSTSIDAFSSTRPSASFSNSRTVGWMVEPQVNYHVQRPWGELSALLGATWQHQGMESTSNNGSNYSSDLLLGSLSAAGNISARNNANEYRYQGTYARLNVNVRRRYIFNITGRRDGSSRFGPENRFANFAAAGAAWLISEEAFLRQVPWISLVKLRGSFGVTGNDQIGDYQYVDRWTPGYSSYVGLSTLLPAALYNPSYNWERNRKLDVALEGRLLNESIGVSVNYFRNVSDNQLMLYTLPIQTGFASILRNMPATVINKGWEVQINYDLPVRSGFRWSSAVNLSIPRNTLADFPDQASSSYRSRFVVGKSLSTDLRYRYLGVDPGSGMYHYVDADGDGEYTVADAVFPASRDTYLFGGFSNTVSYRQFELGITFDFKKQDGYNYMYGMGSTIPGYRYSNQPVIVLQRWQQPGDIAPVQKFTTVTGEVYRRGTLLNSSDAVISDASFIRCRNVSLAYSFPATLTQRAGISGLRLMVQGQNLFTVTGYKGADPENQDLYVLPPLKTFVLGIEITI